MYQPIQYLGDFRESHGSVSGVSSGPTLIVPADPFRVYLAFGMGDGNHQFLSVDPNLTNRTAVYSITLGTSVEVWWERHGLLVTLAWYAAGVAPYPTGGNVVAWQAINWQPTDV
jgi:hypothetical protein